MTQDVATRGAGPYWTLSSAQAFQAADAGPAGLTSIAARARQRRDRPSHRGPRAELSLLLRQFANPITLILIFATIVSAFLGESTESGIILAIVLLSALLSFWQEYAASHAVEQLLAGVHVTVEVWRDGSRRFLPAEEIVPGDLIELDTGDLIPGDALIMDASELLVDEAPLTGESYPVEKMSGQVPADTPIAQRSNCLFMGTHVVRGRATALIMAIGGDTEFGRVAQELERRSPETRFERGLRGFGALLLRVMIVLVVAIFGANLLLARPFLDSLLFSVALAVGLTPQLLPAIVSVSLSLGARRMARARVIVKRLNSIEDFGGMDVLCTDKTGTLTQGAVELAATLDVAGQPSTLVRDAAYLNAFFHTGFANPIDDAILARHEVTTAGSRRIGELPYDFQRKRMSVAVAIDEAERLTDRRSAAAGRSMLRPGETWLLTKGALDGVLGCCDGVLLPDGDKAPVAEWQADIHGRFKALSEQGYRVLGVAGKRVDADRDILLSDEAALTFLGFLTFFDPPKPGIVRTLRELAALGVSLRIVTGDNRLAAGYVANAVRIDRTHLLVGAELEAMSQEELEQRASQTLIFAEVDPIQKERVVRALARGHTVGYLGDGINDAPALHAADVGISVDSAVDVAKDAASIVLLNKDLAVLAEGVRLGRQTFANTLKYIYVTTSANFGNMASMAAATLFLPFLPMLPLQILLLNFLSDLPATTIATDSVDPEQLEEPGVWDLRFIRNFMIVFGLISSAFDVLTFVVLRAGFAADADAFRTGWFLESMLTELTVMLVLRTRRPFFRSRPGPLLLGASILVALVSFALPFTPAAEPLGFVALPPAVLLALASITIGYAATTERAKQYVLSRGRSVAEARAQTAELQ